MGKTRANGEGSIDWVESKGRYRARVSLPDGTRKAVYGTTRAEVASKLTELLKAVKDNVPIPSEQLTVGAYLGEWLDHHTPKIRTSTAERYRRMVEVHVVPAVGRLKLARLEARDLDRLFAAMSAEGKAPATVRQARAIVGRALRDAERQGMVARNVARLTDAPKVERSEMRCFDEEQANSFVDACAGDRFEALFVLAVCHGLRIGELTGLRWPDVDLEAGTVTVRYQLQRLNPRPVRDAKGKAGAPEAPGVTRAAGRWALVPPKTKRSRRAVRLSDVAIEALRNHRVRQAEERLKAGPAWDATWDLVFANEVGRPMSPQNLTRRHFHPVLQGAELPKIRLHDLRHTCATLQLREGVPVNVVSEGLGHEDVALTLNTYAHVLPDQQEGAARAVDAIFRRGR